jgi:hypothetical protein
VIVDFLFHRGVLSIAVGNIGAAPAYAVSVAFDRPFRGFGGERDVSRLALFKRIEFLAPGRRIETLLDSSRSYFQRREPTRLTATIKFRGESGERYERKIMHDLGIYKDLSYLTNPASDAGAAFPSP